MWNLFVSRFGFPTTYLVYANKENWINYKKKKVVVIVSNSSLNNMEKKSNKKR